MRLAFGEGWGNAVSAMIQDSPIYRDTFGQMQAEGFSFDLDDNREFASNRGWFSERSVQAILYDLFDDTLDGADTVALGFGPIYYVLVGPQRDTPAFTSIFSFVTELKSANPGAATGIDAIVTPQSIDSANIDIYGSDEDNDAGGNPDVLPVHAVLTPGGATVNLCSTKIFDDDVDPDGNKLAIFRYLRFSIAAPGNYQFDIVTTNPPGGGETTDPDAVIYLRGQLQGSGESADADSESFSLTLLPGDYVMELYEFSYLNLTVPPIAQDRVCFDVTLTQI